ncbi:putative membrane protein YccC [Marmoricola sp. URHA0025 HA25]
MTQETAHPELVLPTATAVGALLGFLGARVVLVGSGLSLVPWAIAGLALGWFCRSRRLAAAGGGVFGFALAFTFMTTGYDGSEPLGSRLPPFAVLGLVGAVCGTALGIAGQRLRPDGPSTAPDQ